MLLSLILDVDPMAWVAFQLVNSGNLNATYTSFRFYPKSGILKLDLFCRQNTDVSSENLAR